jgi:hypothetical protein
MRAIIRYKLGRMKPWKIVTNNNFKPKLFNSKKQARNIALQFKKKNPNTPFYFRIEEYQCF